MGIKALLLSLTGAKTARKGNCPGDSVVAKGEGMPGQTINPEVYQAPGLYAVPGDGTKGVYLPIGSSRYGVIVAVQNYQITIDVNAGETAIFSTTSDGKTVKSTVILKADGTIEINGSSKNFVTWSELNTALQNHTHSAGLLLAPSGGGPVTGSTGAPIALDITTAKTENVKTGG